MNNQAKNTDMKQSANSIPSAIEQTGLMDQAETLIWKLLDEQLDEQDRQRLEQMIIDHEEVRQRYLECIELHIGLHDLLSKKTDVPLAVSDSPVLGLLGETIAGEMPGADSRPPVG